MLRKCPVRVRVLLLLVVRRVPPSRPVITLIHVLWTGVQRLLSQQVLLGRLKLLRLTRMIPALGVFGLLQMVTLTRLGLLAGPTVLSVWASVVPLLVLLTEVNRLLTVVSLVVLTVLMLRKSRHKVCDPMVG